MARERERERERSGHKKRIKIEEIVKEVYVSESESSNLSGRLLGRWRDKVKECMCEGY